MKLVFKGKQPQSQYKLILPILKKYDLEFIPKIGNINDKGYEYEYIHGLTIQQCIMLGDPIEQTDIIEMKIAMDHIFKTLYDISLKEKDALLNKIMWYHDPILANLIWDFQNKKMTLIDLDSICFAERVPISYINNLFLQPLEYELHKENLRTFTRTL